MEFAEEGGFERWGSIAEEDLAVDESDHGSAGMGVSGLEGRPDDVDECVELGALGRVSALEVETDLELAGVGGWG